MHGFALHRMCTDILQQQINYIQVLFPWRDDLIPSSTNAPDCNILTTCVAWPPSVAGAVLGILQIPCMLFVGTFLGSSTAYQVVCASCVSPFVEFRSAHTKVSAMIAFQSAGQRAKKDLTENVKKNG